MLYFVSPAVKSCNGLALQNWRKHSHIAFTHVVAGVGAGHEEIGNVSHVTASDGLSVSLVLDLPRLVH